MTAMAHRALERLLAFRALGVMHMPRLQDFYWGPDLLLLSRD